MNLGLTPLLSISGLNFRALNYKVCIIIFVPYFEIILYSLNFNENIENWTEQRDRPSGFVFDLLDLVVRTHLFYIVYCFHNLCFMLSNKCWNDIWFWLPMLSAWCECSIYDQLPVFLSWTCWSIEINLFFSIINEFWNFPNILKINKWKSALFNFRRYIYSAIKFNGHYQYLCEIQNLGVSQTQL